jgi:hypothetical protein
MSIQKNQLAVIRVYPAKSKFSSGFLAAYQRTLGISRLQIQKPTSKPKLCTSATFLQRAAN